MQDTSDHVSGHSLTAFLVTQQACSANPLNEVAALHTTPSTALQTPGGLSHPLG